MAEAPELLPIMVSPSRVLRILAFKFVNTNVGNWGSAVDEDSRIAETYATSGTVREILLSSTLVP